MLQIYNKIFNHQIDSEKKRKTLCLHINEYIYGEILYNIAYNFIEKLYFKIHEIEKRGNHLPL